MKKKKGIISLLGVCLLLFLLHSIGVKRILKIVSNLNPYLLAFSLLLFIPISFLQVIRWKLLLKSQLINIRFFPLFFLYLKGLFWGLITPGKIGSFMRIYFLKEGFNLNLAQASISVILDRFSDFLSLCLLALVGSILIFKKNHVFLPMIIFSSAFIISLLLFLLKWQRILRWILMLFLPVKLKGLFGKNLEKFYKSTLSFRHILIPYFVGIISWVFIYLQAYLIILGLEITIPFVYFTTVTPISTLIGFIPVTISGFGTRDAAFIALMSLFNIDPAKAMSLSLLGYMVNAIIPGVYGAIISLIEAVKKRKL